MIANKPSAPWSWVAEPKTKRPQAAGPGRYSRPASIREMIIAGAFGRTLRQLRIDHNLSQRELAETAGVSQAFVAQIEGTRLKGVMFHQVYDFADALQVDPNVFLNACIDACNRFERGLMRRGLVEVAKSDKGK